MHNQFVNYFLNPFSQHRECFQGEKETFTNAWEGFIRGNLINELYPVFQLRSKEPVFSEKTSCFCRSRRSIL